MALVEAKGKAGELHPVGWQTMPNKSEKQERGKPPEPSKAEEAPVSPCVNDGEDSVASQKSSFWWLASLQLVLAKQSPFTGAIIKTLVPFS